MGLAGATEHHGLRVTCFPPKQKNEKKARKGQGGTPTVTQSQAFLPFFHSQGHSLGESVQGGVKTGKGKGREKGQHIGMGVPKVLLTFHSLLPALVGSQAILPGQSHWKRKGSHA